MPNSFSSEKSLPPMHSAISAFATKKEVSTMNSFVGLSFSILCTTLADNIKVKND